MNRVSSIADGGGPRRKRDQLIESAWTLFYRDGYHATGIDRILAESQVAKMTLYHHFRSKEELILAVLEQHSRQTLDSLRQLLDAENRSPEKRLEAGSYWFIAWIRSTRFHGYRFVTAVSEQQEVD